MKFRLLFIFVLLAVAVSLKAQPSTYVYAIRSNVDSLRMDLYQPALPRADKACIIYIHGGSFRTGTRYDSIDALSCSRLAEKGFVVLSLDYRLTVRNIDLDTVSIRNIVPVASHVFQCAVEDCSDATMFVINHADQWNVDTANIFLLGSSAGAITALQTDYCRANHIEWARSLPDSFRYAGVISYSGAIFSNEGTLDYALPPAPTLLFHGTKDRIVTYNQYAIFRYRFVGSNKLSKRFERYGYPFWFYRMEGRTHEVCNLMPLTPDIVAAFADAVNLHTVGIRFEDYQNDQLETPDWAKGKLF